MQLGIDGIPDQADESMLEDEGFLKIFHHVLLEVGHELLQIRLNCA